MIRFFTLIIGLLFTLSVTHAATIEVYTKERVLVLYEDDGNIIEYPIAVGRKGYQWKGVNVISKKVKWPGWYPSPSMRKRHPHLPEYVPGGEDNPLGARALYLGATLYRIHGTNEPESIGHAASSGCIRMFNEDVIDLYERVDKGTVVYVY